MQTEYEHIDNPIPVGPLKLAVLKSFEDFGKAVDRCLVDFRHNSPMRDTKNDIALPGYCEDSYLLDMHISRFGTGEGKGTILESVRGTDLFILVDVTNYSLTYSVCGHENHTSPDNHFQDLKRVISAAQRQGQEDHGHHALPL